MQSQWRSKKISIVIWLAGCLAGVGARAAPPPAAADRPAAKEKEREVLRIALLVANNHGGEGRPALHYAEQDAGDLAAVLAELGGFRADDVHLLRGRPLRDVWTALAGIKSRIAGSQAHGARAVVMFYFSGHSDGQALELGADRWSFEDVRAELQGLGADVRIIVVDSCRSGALITEKGGRPGPTFDIRFTDDLATSGEAVLTSSAANETALESREIHASFFSHHLVSGLRGAADASGDGRVTVEEAYRYAFTHTLLSTSNTLSGPQHPAYDFRLSGQGELVLTDVLKRGARLSIPRELDRVLIADASGSHVLAELTSLSARRVALPAGRYRLQARKGRRAYEVAVALDEGESRDLAFEEFGASERTVASAKGDELDGPTLLSAPVSPLEPSPSPSSRPGFAVAVGVMHGGAASLPWLGAVHLAALFESRHHDALWVLAADGASGRSGDFRESAGYASLGHLWLGRRGPLTCGLGLRAQVGAVLQSLDAGARLWTPAAGLGPAVSASLALGRRFALGLSGEAAGMLFRRDGAVAAALWPAARVFLELRP